MAMPIHQPYQQLLGFLNCETTLSKSYIKKKKQINKIIGGKQYSYAGLPATAAAGSSGLKSDAYFEWCSNIKLLV